MEGTSEHAREVSIQRPSSPQKIQQNSNSAHGCEDMKDPKLAFSPLKVSGFLSKVPLSPGKDMQGSADEPLMSVDEFLKQRGKRNQVRSAPKAEDNASECSEILFDGTELSPPNTSPLPRQLSFPKPAEARNDTGKTKNYKSRAATKRRITEGVEKVKF